MDQAAGEVYPQTGVPRAGRTSGRPDVGPAGRRVVRPAGRWAWTSGQPDVQLPLLTYHRSTCGPGLHSESKRQKVFLTQKKSRSDFFLRRWVRAARPVLTTTGRRAAELAGTANAEPAGTANVRPSEKIYLIDPVPHTNQVVKADTK